MNIAVIGYGGVGKALIRLLNMQKKNLLAENLLVKVKYVVDYYGGIYQGEGIDLPALIAFTEENNDITQFNGGSEWVTVSSVAADNSVDLAVIMTPTNKETGQPGADYVRELLKAKKHVVISDKGPIMLYYHELNRLAAENGVQLCIGCTTGGALPSVNGGLIDMAGADVESIEGILNGTTNFILKYMEEHGCEYADALSEAQRLGIAETDPSLDVEGWDTAGKLLILTNVLMKECKTLADIEVTGITGLTAAEIKKAAAEHKKYKLVGKTTKKDGRLLMTVRPEMISEDQLLYTVEGKNKAVRYQSQTLGELVIIGGASGVIPAAASILRDVVNVHRGYQFSRQGE